MKRALFFLLLCMLLCPLFSAEAADAPIDTFVVGTTMKIQSTTRGDYNYNVLSGLFTHLALIRQDETGAWQPMLAARFSVSDDGCEWTFVLREGDTWEDGTPVTAQDVAFTMRRDGTSQAFTRMRDIRTPDAHTVVCTYDTPYTRLPVDLLTLRILPSHIFEDVPDLNAYDGPGATMGCGPYRLTGFDTAAGVLTFEARDDFSQGMPNVQTVQVRLYGNMDTLSMALSKGDVDMIYLYANGVDASTAAFLSANERLTIQQTPDTGVNLIYFNAQDERLSNPRMREAIACALDYDRFALLFGTSYATAPHMGLVPPGLAGYVDTPVRTRDLERARTLLEEAGVTEPITLPLLIRNDKPVYARMAELITQNLAEIGIKMEIQTADTAQFRTISEKERTHTLLLSRATPWGMAMNAGLGVGYMDARATGQGNVKDPAFQALADQMTSAAPDDYPALCAQVQQYYAKQTPAVALFYDVFLHAYDRHFGHFTLDNTFGLLNEQTWFTLTKEDDPT